MALSDFFIPRTDVPDCSECGGDSFTCTQNFLDGKPMCCMACALGSTHGVPEPRDPLSGRAWARPLVLVPYEPFGPAPLPGPLEA